MRMALIFGLLALGVACTDGSGDDEDLNDTSDTDESGCPDGLAPASASGALISAYIQNGVGLTLAFDPSLTTSSGQPAACVSGDRLMAQWLLSAAGEPALLVKQSVTSFGSQPIDGSTASLVLEVIGAETTAPGDWQTALWTADVSGATLTSIIDGTAITANGGTYRLNAALEITP